MNTTIEPPNGRGCGDRVDGEAYACCGVGADGMPIHYFVVDPPRPWPGEWHRGIEILPRNPRQPDGVKDLVIFVGKGPYPSPWDFIEEARLFGTSRRMPPDLPYHELTPGPGGSMQIFVHAHTIPQFEYLANRNRPYANCKLRFDEEGTVWKGYKRWGWHPCTPNFRQWYGREDSPCTFALRDLAWLVHDDVTPQLTFDDEMGPVDGYRVEMPSFSYEGRYPTLPVPNGPGPYDMDWKAGIFLAMPLSHFEFRGEAPAEKMEAIHKAGFEVAELDW